MDRQNALRELKRKKERKEKERMRLLEEEERKEGWLSINKEKKIKIVKSYTLFLLP